MTTEEKFHAAVNVIRNLPKNGSFQPSTDLQLKFYSYFKQATNGVNKESRPSFWDITGLAKWSAWKKLGDMPQETAMEQYIEQLKSIVETMSYNSDVATFLKSLGTFYDYVPAHDVDLVLGPVIEKVKSRAQSETQSIASPDSEFPSSESSSFAESIESRSNSILKSDTEVSSTFTYSSNVSPNSSPVPLKKATVNVLARVDESTESEDSEEEFNDTIEHTPEPIRKFSTPIPKNESISALSKTVERLQTDLNLLTTKMRMLETSLAKSRVSNQRDQGPLSMSPLFIGFLVVWPLAATYFVSRFNQKRSP